MTAYTCAYIFQLLTSPYELKELCFKFPRDNNMHPCLKLKNCWWEFTPTVRDCNESITSPLEYVGSDLIPRNQTICTYLDNN